MDKKERQKLEQKIIEDTYDPVTLEDVAEKEKLLIEDEYSEPANIVKKAYKNLKNGHAFISKPFSYIVLIGMCMFAAIGVFFLYLIIKDLIDGKIEVVLIFCELIFAFALFGTDVIMYRVFIKSHKKLFDVYYFEQDKKRIIIFQNKKYTVYYRNRKEVVCINNKTREWDADYGYEDYMNLRLGFNGLVGNLKLDKRKNGDFVVWTPARYKTASGLHTTNGYASLRCDSNFFPKRVIIGGGSNEDHIYNFLADKEFKVKIPFELVEICYTCGIEPPKTNEWIEYFN